MLRQEIEEREPAAGAAGRLLVGTSHALALFGGCICGFMAVMVCVSVTGRYLFSAPIPGDYDIVGILSGCAAFSFLPYCQLTRGNVVVDFFTNNLHPRARAALDALAMVLYLAVALLFTWRMYYGMLDLRAYQEVISAFEFHRWWTVPFNIFCMLVLIAVILRSLSQDLREFAGPTGAVSAGEGEP